MSPRWRLAAVVAVVAAPVATLVADASPLWLIAVVCLCWALRLRPRLGLGGAVALAGAVAVASIVGAAYLAPALTLGFADVSAVAAGLAGLAAFIVPEPNPRTLFTDFPLRGALLVVTPAAAWLGVWGLSWVIPGASALSWAMAGDSSNNVLFARDLAQAGGVPASSTNPVPLPHALIALAMPADASAAGDIRAYAAVWALVIAAFIAALAALGLTIAKSLGASPRGELAAALATALLGWTWFVTGYSMDQGFFNAHVSLVCITVSLCVSLWSTSRASGAALVCAQALLALLVFLTWTPLAAVPGLLLLASGVRWLRARPRVSELMVPAGVVVAVGGVASVLVVRNAAAAASAFDAPGGALEIHPVVIGVVLEAAAVAALFARGLPANVTEAVRVGLGGIVLALMATLALAGLHWSYYPLKMAWFALVVVAMVAIPTLVGLASRRAGGRGLVTLVASLAIPCGLLLAPRAVDILRGAQEVTSEPATMLLTGDTIGGGDTLFDAVARGSNGDTVEVMWGTGSEVEREANFWVVNLSSGRYAPIVDEERRFDVRIVAYRLLQGDPSVLCELEPEIGSPVVVVTADAAVTARDAVACPTIDVRPWREP